MTEQNQIYKCIMCGNIVEGLHAGEGELVCCGQPMELQLEKTADPTQEKHVPVIEKTDSGAKVRVGFFPHPMQEQHFVEWIEIITDDGICRKFLKPGNKPEAEFRVRKDSIKAREYCNLHGLWES